MVYARNFLGTQQQLGGGRGLRWPFNEVFTVFVILEYLSAFYPSDHNMMQEAGSI